METVTTETTLEEKIAELETDIEDLEKQITDLEKDKEELESEKDDLEEQVDELERETAGIERLNEVINLFADPSNWDGNTWKPFMQYIEKDPQFLASKALG